MVQGGCQHWLGHAGQPAAGLRIKHVEVFGVGADAEVILIGGAAGDAYGDGLAGFEAAVDDGLGAEGFDKVYRDAETVGVGLQVFGADPENDGLAVSGVAGGKRDDGAGVEVGSGAIAGERAGKEVHGGRTDEAGDEGIGGAFEDLHGGGELGGVALVENEQSVAEGHGLYLVVGDVEAGDTEAALQAADLAAHLDAKLGIEVGEGFVEQEEPGLADDGAAHGDALALAAGELAGLAGEERADFELVGRLFDAAADFRAGKAANTQAVGHVVEHGHVRIERIVLEHHGDVASGGVGGGDVAAIKDDPAGGGLFEAGDDPEQGGFAAAGGADDDEHLAVVEAQVECFKDRGLAKALVDAGELEGGHYFSASVSPATNHRCMATTTITGGMRARTAVAMTPAQSVSPSVLTMRVMPMAMVSRWGVVATSSGQRYWFQP